MVFWYSRQGYDSSQRKKGFPLCIDAQKDLPPSLAEFARIGDVSYITSTSNQSTEIRLLVMKSFLADLFPPVSKFSDHGMLRKWLFSVPFPAPVINMDWKRNDGDNCIVKEIKKLIPFKCFEKDNYFDWRSNVDLDMFESFHSYNIGFKQDEFAKITGLVEPIDNGNDKIISYSMPFVKVKRMRFSKKEYSHQYSWFLSVFKMIYNDTLNFTVPEWKRCLVAFWKCHQLLNDDVDYRRMWSTRIPEDVHVDTNNWKSICDYWNEEVERFLTDDRYTVNELLFDNFCKMLSEQGFQDDSDPFYFGYVSTKFSTQ